MAKPSKTAGTTRANVDMAILTPKTQEHALNRENEPFFFPPLPDHLTGCTAIGLASVLAGRRLKLGARVLTGSWRHEDGTVTQRYSRWVEYERVIQFTYKVGGKERTYRQRADAITLVPETDYVAVLSFAAFAERKRIA